MLDQGLNSAQRLKAVRDELSLKAHQFDFSSIASSLGDRRVSLTSSTSLKNLETLLLDTRSVRGLIIEVAREVSRLIASSDCLDGYLKRAAEGELVNRYGRQGTLYARVLWSCIHSDAQGKTPDNELGELPSAYYDAPLAPNAEYRSLSSVIAFSNLGDSRLAASLTDEAKLDSLIVFSVTLGFSEHREALRASIHPVDSSLGIRCTSSAAPDLAMIRDTMYRQAVLPRISELAEAIDGSTALEVRAAESTVRNLI
ncbi:MAG: hypothetical protein KDD53_08130, partial [Bdellovibrionales bacterium]|nr:hypothetical protein [Bdellovibrionales bacterium]